MVLRSQKGQILPLFLWGEKMIRDYQSGDAKKILLQAQQAVEAQTFADGFERVRAYTLIDDDGEVLAVCGFEVFFDNNEKTAQCYALIGQNIGGKLLTLVRFLKKEIAHEAARLKIKQVVMTVRDDFGQAKRLALMLGFVPVRVMEDFFDGKNYQLYERSFYYGGSGTLN